MQVTRDEIEPAVAKEIRKWLQQGVADAFLQLLESEAFENECRAVEHLMAGTETGKKEAAADVDMALKIRFSINLFKKYIDADQYVRAKAAPNDL